VVKWFSFLYSNKVGYSTSSPKSDTVFSSFLAMLGNARRMISSLGDMVVEGELLARELLTLYHSLDVEEGRKVWEYLWRGGRLKVNHMFLSRSTGDERDGDLKVQFNDMFGNAITIFVNKHDF